MGLCCFNCLVPTSDDNCVIVPPDGCTFINGLARNYSEEFDSVRFKNRIDKKNFT